MTARSAITRLKKKNGLWRPLNTVTRPAPDCSSGFCCRSDLGQSDKSSQGQSSRFDPHHSQAEVRAERAAKAILFPPCFFQSC